jgi:hypothetical protein
MRKGSLIYVEMLKYLVLYEEAVCIYIYLLKARGPSRFFLRFFVFTILREKDINIGCIKALELAL